MVTSGSPTLPPLLRSRPLILLPFGGAEDHGPWIFADQQHFRSLVDQDKIEMVLSAVKAPTAAPGPANGGGAAISVPLNVRPQLPSRLATEQRRLPSSATAAPETKNAKTNAAKHTIHPMTAPSSWVNSCVLRALRMQDALT